LIEFTIDTGSVSPISRTSRSASSKFPSMATTFAPYMNACTSLPIAIFPAGSSTMHEMPARAAYAAAAAEVLPVEAQITAFEPASTAFEMATVIPRSLKEPVGFSPSYLI
jgi:hypothetical protein